MTVKKRTTVFLFILTAFILFLNLVLGFGAEKYQIRALKIYKKIEVNGSLDEPSWKKAPVTNEFTQREPQEGQPATEQTEVRILYDDTNLYIGLVCFDSQADKIVANEMRRDVDLQDNDYFQIMIDSFHDHRNAFYFIINPLGAKRDGLIRDDGTNINWDWDGIWITRARRTTEGWTAEIAIPFYTLRFRKDSNQTWGINFGRQIARTREEVYWTPVLRDYGFYGQYKVSACGDLVGLDNLSQGRKIQFMPYVIGGGVQEERSDPFSRSEDLGYDLKYRLTSNLTADITVNTDFAQVEADQEQFNITPFSLYFPEKRGFFLEGADIFRFGERYQELEPPTTLLFFSRTIGLSEEGHEIPIIGGVRVTGKTGKYTLGLLDILTESTSYEEDGEQIYIHRANYSVFRVKRDFLEKSTFGVMLLSKDLINSSYYNRGAGFDFDLSFGRSLKMGGFAAKTFTPDLEGKGWAANFDFVWQSDFLIANGSYTDIGENFNAELGFITRTDIRKYRLNVGIGPRPNILNIRQVFLFNDFYYIENHSGQLESRINLTGMFNLFQNGSYLVLGYMPNYEYLTEDFEIKEDVFIPTGGYRFDQFLCWYQSDKSKDIAVQTQIYWGQFYNGNLFKANTSGFLKLSKNFSLEFIYDRNQFDLPVEGGKFTTNIVATRIIYSFTPDIYAKAYLQWNDDEELFITNFLVRWIYKPGANIYLIYNESRKLGAEGYIQDRALMLKISFLFS